MKDPDLTLLTELSDDDRFAVECLASTIAGADAASVEDAAGSAAVLVVALKTNGVLLSRARVN